MKKDLEWLRAKVEDEECDAYSYKHDVVVIPTDILFKLIDQVDNTGCNWTPSEKTKQEPTMWRDYSYTSPSSQKQPPLNPKAVLHSNITAELNAIYVAKNSDYGDAFGETYKKLGIISAVTRITDKVNRLQSLATKSESERLVKDESIRDTLMDLSNYAILTLIEMDIEKGVNPFVGEKVDVTADGYSLDGGMSTDDAHEAMKQMSNRLRSTVEYDE